MKIAVEGMDGVGKSTVARAIAERFDCHYVVKPFAFLFANLGFDEKQIKAIERALWETEDEAIITLLYGMGLLYGTRCINQEKIVYDRHYASNYYWHGNEETDKLHKQIIILGGLPDLTIVLRASVETRIERIYKRDKADLDLSNSAMYDYGYDKIISFLEENSMSYVIIDTENKTISDVIDESISCVKKIQSMQIIKERK